MMPGMRFPDPREKFMQAFEQIKARIPQAPQLGPAQRQTRAPLPQNGQTWNRTLSDALLGAGPQIEGIQFDRGQKQGIDQLNSIDDQMKAFLEEMNGRNPQAPERQHVDKNMAMWAGLAAALGRLGGAHSAPQHLQTFLQNQEGMYGQKWGEAMDRYESDIQRQERMDRAKLQGLQIDAGKVERNMGYEQSKFQNAQAQRMAQQKAEQDQLKADRDYQISLEELNIKRQNLVPDAIRTMQSLIQVGYSENLAFDMAFANAKATIGELGLKLRLEPHQIAKMQAEVDDLKEQTKLRPRTVAVNEMNAKTGRMNAENMGRYRDRSLDIQDFNAQTGRINSEKTGTYNPSPEESATIEEKKRVKAGLVTEFTALQKRMELLAQYDALTGDAKEDFYAAHPELDPYLSTGGALNRTKDRLRLAQIKKGMTDIDKRIAELQQGARPSGMVPAVDPFAMGGGASLRGRIG